MASIDHDRIHAQVQIQGWDTHTSTWRWMDLDDWTLQQTTGAAVSSWDDIAADLTISALERGWALSADEVRASMPTPTAPVQVSDYTRILTTLAIHKHPVDAGLLNLLADLPPTGAPGHVPWSMVATMFGLERRSVAALRHRLAGTSTD